MSSYDLWKLASPDDEQRPDPDDDEGFDPDAEHDREVGA